MSDDTKNRILDAAEGVFADKGLAGARVAAMAEAAGVNKAMLYYYFGSKVELYQAVLARVADQIELLASSALTQEEASPLQRIEAFLDGYHSVLGSHPNFVRIMIRESLNGAEHVGPLFRERFAAIMPIMAKTLAGAQISNEINPEVSFPIAAPIMISPFVFFAFARPIMEQVFGPMTAESAADYHRSAKAIILNGLRARVERS